MSVAELTTSYHSYPKVYALGHAAIKELLLDPVVVEEKVDGSQFSFGVFSGQLRCRSRRQEIDIEHPEQLFQEGVESAMRLRHALVDGWTYRAEYLKKPKHNTLKYSRIPKGHLILFDINKGHEEYAARDDLCEEAERLGLEVVPELYAGPLDSIEQLRELLDRESILGGEKIEGVVIKNHKRFGADGKALFGKLVCDDFKERHDKGWKKDNPAQKDVIQRLIETYRTQPRWLKAVHHLRDEGRLAESPTDIGPLCKEVQSDVLEECEEEIKQALFAWAWPNIKRGITGGLAEWYKERLLERQFEQ